MQRKQRMFPKTRFIHLLRHLHAHGRAVVAAIQEPATSIGGSLAMAPPVSAAATTLAMKAASQPHISGAGWKRAATTPMVLESFVADQLFKQDGAVCAKKSGACTMEKPTGHESCQIRRDTATSNLFNKGSVNESRKVHQLYPNARASARTSGENPAPSSRHENGEVRSSGSAGSAGNEGLRRNAASSP
jgi:hypothetical protein